MTTDPTTPPCLSDDPVPIEVREADAMLGMWAEMFRLRRAAYGVEGALDDVGHALRHLPNAEVRGLLYAALARLTEPARDER